MTQPTDMKVAREFGRDQERRVEDPAEVAYLHVTDGRGVEWLIYADRDGGLLVGLSGADWVSGALTLVPQTTGTVSVRRG
jgi:hypothetical protein